LEIEAEVLLYGFAEASMMGSFLLALVEVH
jgi:hypothetical protein